MWFCLVVAHVMSDFVPELLLNSRECLCLVTQIQTPARYIRVASCSPPDAVVLLPFWAQGTVLPRFAYNATNRRCFPVFQFLSTARPYRFILSPRLLKHWCSSVTCTRHLTNVLLHFPYQSSHGIQFSSIIFTAILCPHSWLRPPASFLWSFSSSVSCKLVPTFSPVPNSNARAYGEPIALVSCSPVVQTNAAAVAVANHNTPQIASNSTSVSALFIPLLY